MCKRLAIFFLACFVACSCASAFSFTRNAKAEEAAPEPEQAIVLEEGQPAEEAPGPMSPTPQESKGSSTSQGDSSQALSEISTTLDGRSLLTKGDIAAIGERLEVVSQGVEVMAKDIEEKQQIIDAQAEQVAKAKKAKFYASIGGVVGFKDSEPQWGLSTDMGVRFGGGLMVGAGLGYMVGSFTELPTEFDVDGLTIRLSVGKEW